MPELVRCHHVRVLFMDEMGSQFLERFLHLSARDDAFLGPKQIVGFKVVWKGLGPLPASDEWPQSPHRLAGWECGARAPFSCSRGQYKSTNSPPNPGRGIPFCRVHQVL